MRQEKKLAVIEKKPNENTIMKQNDVKQSKILNCTKLLNIDLLTFKYQ